MFEEKIGGWSREELAQFVQASVREAITDTLKAELASRIRIPDRHVDAGVLTFNASLNAYEDKTPTGGAGGYSTIQDEGVGLTARTTLDFQGAGVTATDGGTKTIVTIPGGGGSAYNLVQDEGSALTARTTIDFVGAGVTATDTGAKTQVSIPVQPAYATIQDEGVALTQRSTLNFTGAGVTATDSGGVTVVNIPNITGNPINVPSCLVNMAAAQSIPNGVITTFNFDTEVFDTDNMHSTTVNNNRITFNKTGTYIVGGRAIWAASAVNVQRYIEIRTNGTTVWDSVDVPPIGGGGQSQHDITTLLSVNAGDYFELRVYQDSGAAMNVTGSAWAISIQDNVGISWTETEVDFGSTGVYDKTFTITDGAATSTSKIIAIQSGNVATGRVGNDADWDSIDYACLPGTGSFTLIAKANPGPVVGKRKVYYSIS